MLDYGFYNMDCMEGMGEFPDKYFDLAIVDPPYGAGKFEEKRKYLDSKIRLWNKKPSKRYFDELKRISKYQIIWGGNYFNLGRCKCFLIWDKINLRLLQFADIEFAWTNFDKVAKIFKCVRPGNSGFYISESERIHPNQKPMKLYRWCLQNYAREGWTILDTHVGSGSSLIACEQEGFKYVGFEIDEEYYTAAMQRIKAARAQLMLDLH